MKQSPPATESNKTIRFVDIQVGDFVVVKTVTFHSGITKARRKVVEVDTVIPRVGVNLFGWKPYYLLKGEVLSVERRGQNYRVAGTGGVANRIMKELVSARFGG